MKILFLTDNFPPETNAPAIRTYEHARIWAREGHDVTIITGAPNFPTGRVHEGYRNVPYSVEQIDGIRVVRVWTFMRPNEGHIRRTLDYMSFMLSSFPAAIIQKRPDVIVGTSPQLLTVVSAWAAARVRRVPFVFELRDLWPESFVAVEAVTSERAIRAIAALADFLYSRAEIIVSVTRSFVTELGERGVPEEKVVVVRNGVTLSDFPLDQDDGGLREEIGIAAGDFLATYLGTLGMAHALERVIEAAELTKDEPIHYLLVGEGAEKERLEGEVARRGLDNVTFLGAQPRERVPQILSASNALIVHLRDDPLFRTVIPSKMFEAMAAARPIVLGVRGESAEIVESAEAGIVITPESPQELAEAIHRLRHDPALAERLGLNGRRAAEGEFCRRSAAAKMLSALKHAAERREGPVILDDAPPCR